MEFCTDWKFTQWQLVERIANNDAARVAALVPIVGYLILFNDQIADLASFQKIAGIEPNAASPFFLDGLTKMRLVFIGCLLLLLSNMIFRICRPDVLEYAKGDIEFSARVNESYSVHELTNMESEVFSDRWRPRLPMYWMVQDEIRAKKPLVSGYSPTARLQMFSKHGDYISFLAREWWTGKMHTYRVARFASLFLGVTGFLLLGLPTLDISQAVVRDVFLNMW